MSNTIMPPGDTTIILKSFDELPDSVRRIVDSLAGFSFYQHPDEQRGPTYPFPEWAVILFVFGIGILSAYLYIIRPAQKQKSKISDHYKRKEPVGKWVQDHQYDQWLGKYNPYYSSLSLPLKKRFLHRTQQFIQSKEFRFHAMVEEEYIVVLVSASAVQLTFGLQNYQMDYFDVVHVMRKEYVLNIDKETYYGHVSKNGIHISWNRFMEGYSDYTDSENVGLHEMAHALSYDVYLGVEDRHDSDLKNRLNDFAEEAKSVFRTMRQKGDRLFDDYALSNFDEFWATSIEIFFEKPEEFKKKLPNLYRQISELLNQDPLLENKLLDHGVS
ncbi:MAG: hypothetical protein HOP10_09745 [Chitinophagaceae bacterium]|nr:hypothetical protein [Chitinophagaceae bacterium]